MEIEMDENGLTVRDPKYRHWAFLAPLAVSIAGSLFGPKEPAPQAASASPREEEESEEVKETPEPEPGDGQVLVDQNDGSITIQDPSFDELSLQDQNEYALDMIGSIEADWKSWLKQGASNLWSGTKKVASAASEGISRHMATPSQAASTTEDEPQMEVERSEEEEEAEDSLFAKLPQRFRHWGRERKGWAFSRWLKRRKELLARLRERAGLPSAEGNPR